MKTRFLLFLLIPLLLNCSDDPIGPTELVLDYTTNGLEITLTGSATNSSHPITNLKIDWGDASDVKIIESGFDSIIEIHKYGNEAIYNLIITATNSIGDTTIEHLAVTVSFKETSLDGIRQSLYKTAEDEYLFLTLNLHTYQEKDQLEKFNMIIDVIGNMDIDFIAFQECAQHKSSPIIDGAIRQDNMAYLIVTGLQAQHSTSYEYIWDWSHYGWGVWEEGIAILSKYPIISQEARYISSATSVNTIESRKVIYGACQLPDGKLFNVFSTHLHWRTSISDQEQNNQVKNMQAMVDEKSGLDSYSFVCGDFNVNPTNDPPWNEAYYTMVGNNSYTDSYLVIHDDANNLPPRTTHNTTPGNVSSRIDFIFMKSNADFEVIDSQIIFKPDIVGMVSDHYGVLTKVKLAK